MIGACILSYKKSEEQFCKKKKNRLNLSDGVYDQVFEISLIYANIYNKYCGIYTIILFMLADSVA